MSERTIVVTEAEAVSLLLESSRDRPLAMSWGTQRLIVAEDGSSDWAVQLLEELRKDQK